MELVFEPDLCDGEEAAALVRELTLVLTALNTCLCRIEGSYLLGYTVESLGTQKNLIVRGEGLDI